MPPPAQRRHAPFSETRMNGAKRLSFCGALARALLIGVEDLPNGIRLFTSGQYRPVAGFVNSDQQGSR